MDLTTFYWVATHNNKIITTPNYANINRDNLQKVDIYQKKGGELLLTIVKPIESKFKFAIRLKSAGAPSSYTGELLVDVRYIIAYDGIRYYCIFENGDIVTADTMKEMDFAPFPFNKILLHEEE